MDKEDILSLVVDDSRQVWATDNNCQEPLDGIPYGEHDKFLHKLASWLRGQEGLSEDAIARFLQKGPLQALQGMDLDRPYTWDDCCRIAHSAASYVPSKAFELIDDVWTTALDLPGKQPITRWHLYNFVPQHELVLQYGTGGIGKSTWLSWLVGTLLKKGLKCGFSASEEPFSRFTNRVHMAFSDFDYSLLGNLYDIGNRWVFPKDADKLRTKLEECHLDFIYFDSIYSHFDPALKMPNLAEKARPVLTPLIQIAQEMGITIFGTFHENKSGDFNGPKDMENIPRVMIHATRKGTKLKLQVHKTNFNDPSYALYMLGEPKLEISHTGEIVEEENEEGIISQKELYVVTGYEKTDKDYAFGLLEENEIVKQERDSKIMEYISSGMSYRDIEKEYGISKSAVGRVVKRNNS